LVAPRWIVHVSITSTIAANSAVTDRVERGATSQHVSCPDNSANTVRAMPGVHAIGPGMCNLTLHVIRNATGFTGGAPFIRATAGIVRAHDRAASGRHDDRLPDDAGDQRSTEQTRALVVRRRLTRL
jgi:hypothetical protein